MKRLLLLLLLLLIIPIVCVATAPTESIPSMVRYSGTGTNDNDILFTTVDMREYDACVLMSTTGTVDVFVSLDATPNWSTAPLSLQDFGAVDTTPAIVTVALRVYGFVGKYRFIKVLQNGATGAAASLNCWKL